MYLAVKQQLKHLTKEEYCTIREMCRISKDLYNQALYEIRQEWFKSKKFLRYCDVYKILKNTDNFKLLQSTISQHTLMKVDHNFNSFLVLKDKGENVKIPNYLKKDGFFRLCIPQVRISQKGRIKLPFSKPFGKAHKRIFFKVPSCLSNKDVKQVWIVPKQNARFFEIHFIYKIDELKRKTNNNALAIDLGVNNFCTCVDSFGKSFIVDGKRIKSWNQWYNKHNSYLQSIKDKQSFGKNLTKTQSKLLKKRNNRILDYIHKTSKYIINYCLKNDISIIVLGNNIG